MRKLQAIAACLALLLSGLTPLWGDNKKQKNTKKTVSEETYLGSISCTVKTFKVAPQPPAVDDAALPNPGNNPAPRNPRNDNALQNHGDNPAPQTQGANAVPPAAPGDAASPTPAQNLSATKPIATLKDCLVHGGQVVMLVDGTQKGILIDNPDAIKGHEWHRLSISGYMRGSAFHVVSVRII